MKPYVWMVETLELDDQLETLEWLPLPWSSTHCREIARGVARAHREAGRKTRVRKYGRVE